MKTLILVVALSVAVTSSAGQSAPQWRLVEELRLDGAAEDFSNFRSFLVGRDGRIVVPQLGDYNVRVYDAAGKRIATFGRQGSGPGEFARYVSDTDMGWVGDTTWIYAFNERRLTLMAPNGTLLRTTPMLYRPGSDSSAAPSFVSSKIHAILPGGAMLADAQFRVPDGRGLDAWESRFVLLSRDATYLRTIAPRPKWTGGVNVCRPPGCYGASVPFAVEAFVDVARDGSAIAFLQTTMASNGRGSYRLTVLRPGGDTLFTRAYPFTGVRIPPRVLDSAMAAMQSRMRPGRAGQDVNDELIAKVRAALPSFYAPVVGLRAGQDGTFWLELASTDATRRYQALDNRGAVIGEVRLPHNAELMRASRTTVWTIERDADDLPSVVRYRTRPPASSPSSPEPSVLNTSVLDSRFSILVGARPGI